MARLAARGHVGVLLTPDRALKGEYEVASVPIAGITPRAVLDGDVKLLRAAVVRPHDACGPRLAVLHPRAADARPAESEGLAARRELRGSESPRARYIASR